MTPKNIKNSKNGGISRSGIEKYGKYKKNEKRRKFKIRARKIKKLKKKTKKRRELTSYLFKIRKKKELQDTSLENKETTKKRRNCETGLLICLKYEKT